MSDAHTTPVDDSPPVARVAEAKAEADASSHAPPAEIPNAEPTAHPVAALHHSHRRRTIVIIGIVAVIIALIAGIPWLLNVLSTVSTDDAYVNGHVTLVAPRVPGQVIRVLVDDNNRVHKGDLLVQLDPEPYQVAVNIAQAAVTAAQADLTASQAQARATEAQVRSARFALEHAIEDVDNQVALLKAKAATLASERATLANAQAQYDRALPLSKTGAVATEEMDRRTEALRIAESGVEEALQGVYQIRVALGLPLKPESGDDLTQVPPDLDQTFSSVREAQAKVLQGAAELGISDSFNKSPKQMVADFYKRDPQGDIDKIYAKLAAEAPAVKQAEAKLAQAQRNLDQANLNLRYCNVFADIDGVITRRNVNPGNNVIVGESLMAIRSLTDIWIDANFKETQLASLRIGQSVDIDTDIYGNKERFKGRITGFTMGTGSTLALLPPENATGNFVKVVQRLPVRIDLVNYDPDKTPLFVGLSVEPSVHIKEEPTGPNAGKVLQPYLPTTTLRPAETQP